MKSTNKNSDPLENFTKEQFANLGQSIEALDEDEKAWNQQKREDAETRRLKKRSFRRVTKSLLEMINRLLLLFFFVSFLISFALVYSINPLWFLGYVFSAFSCVLYMPNRKALKELIAAWPNIQDLLKKIDSSENK